MSAFTTAFIPAVFDPNFGEISWQTVCPQLYELGSNQTQSKLIVYAFNHTAGRFQHALGLDKFRKFVAQFPDKIILIIEFGVGDAKSAQNNPRELAQFALDGKQYQVVKFWYDIDFKFSATTENTESMIEFQDYIKSLKLPLGSQQSISDQERKQSTPRGSGISAGYPVVFAPNFGKISWQTVCSGFHEINQGESTPSDKVFFAFNHTCGRFQHALGVERFREFVKNYIGKTIVILEFGVGDAKSACNNPPELTWFELDGKKYQVVKFWYDIDFKFSAKAENEESMKQLSKLL